MKPQSKNDVENWQCQSCSLCMDKQFVKEHTELTGHKQIIKTDPWEIVINSELSWRNLND